MIGLQRRRRTPGEKCKKPKSQYSAASQSKSGLRSLSTAPEERASWTSSVEAEEAAAEQSDWMAVADLIEGCALAKFRRNQAAAYAETNALREFQKIFSCN